MGQEHDHDHHHHHYHDHNPKEKVEEHHGHTHRRPRGEERKMLMTVMILTGAMMVVELIGGIIAGSLSLLSDALHMFTHFFAMGVSYFAIVLALRQAPQDKTFKYWRLEILAAFFNGICLIPMVGYIFYMSWVRMNNPKEIDTLTMLLVAFAGLLNNIACAVILHKSSKEDINVRSAFIHMLTDALSSVGVMAAGGVILLTGWCLADPIAALIVGVMVLIWSLKLLRDSCHVLIEAAPSHLDIHKVEDALLGVEGVKEVHDIHLWTITSKMYSLTAHVILDGDMHVSDTSSVAEKIEHLLDEQFDITHSCLQFESHDLLHTHTHD